MRIRIVKCKDPMLWYNKHIGEYFKLERLWDTYGWVREKDEFQCLNFVLIEDFEVVEEE